MLENAARHGVPVDSSVIEALPLAIPNTAKPFENTDLKDSGPRRVLAGDEFHATAVGKSLAAGDGETVNVDSAQLNCWTGIRLDAEESTSFQCRTTANGMTRPSTAMQRVGNLKTSPTSNDSSFECSKTIVVCQKQTGSRLSVRSTARTVEPFGSVSAAHTNVVAPAIFSLSPTTWQTSTTTTKGRCR